ncbi:rRNA-processing protein FCF1 -like protein [Sarcoptes scabiei]|uniref:rRNA-processing protein FCF1 -like protein n=1 Tax=Sarcoptes scabiei TaxID=52283 RepID=A0A131ZV34_SARSC|nr:rRNA-processing protein FCF1 -like protein [Sarcoptes scabiei]KPM02678.1 rRNA-processing protein FCF1-like protein [Sarcoptes scabiei]UXI16650.1 Synaptosomal-associated protein 25 [Sarcoptes scabiei]
MGKLRVPKLLSIKDSRVKNQMKPRPLKKKQREKIKKAKKKLEDQSKPAVVSTTMFFHYNLQLGPPFRIICDTNFINFSIKNKLDIMQSMMDCLLAKCIPMVTDCIVAELQTLGQKYRLALKIVKEQFERLPCSHKGIYADDCIVNRVQQHKCFIVGTCDKALKRRIRKIPGIPIMFLVSHQYTIERMPDAYGIRT